MTGSAMVGGRYVLGEVLGTGGMATVWRGTDTVLGREVAVKVLSPQYAADPAFAARFEREARHAARLSHPRLVTVFDCGVDAGTAFIVMELVDGRTLRQVLDEAGTLPPGQAAAIAAGVCEALEVAHAAGLVHRDIKPANIALAGGEVKVLDFGIARADGSAGGTRTQGVLGTAAYLSPEQAAGRAAGPRSDLYSLGCVLFEMLTGAPPFTADTPVGLAYRHVHDDPGPPSARRPGLPGRLDQVTARLLAKDPSARPSSAAAARAALLSALTPHATTVLSPHATTVLSPGAFASAPAGRRRASRTEIGLATALAAALVTLAFVLLAGPVSHAAHTPPGHPAASSHAPAGKLGARKPHPAIRSRPRAARNRAGHLPRTAAAAAAFVGNLQAGVADGQVTQQAGQDLYNQLQQVLFTPPGRDPHKAQKAQQQYAHLINAFDQHLSQGQITGHAATALRHALAALGATFGY